MRLRLGLVAISFLFGCSGEIVAPGGSNPGGPSGAGGSGGPQGNGAGPGGMTDFPPQCTDPSAGGGAPCEVSANCASPYVCIGGICQPPAGAIACDVDHPCQPGLTCSGGACQRVPGACTQNAQCPTGMQC